MKKLALGSFVGYGPLILARNCQGRGSASSGSVL